MNEPVGRTEDQRCHELLRHFLSEYANVQRSEADYPGSTWWDREGKSDPLIVEAMALLGIKDVPWVVG